MARTKQTAKHNPEAARHPAGKQLAKAFYKGTKFLPEKRKKKRRRDSGQLALIEIKHFQKTVNPLLPRAHFQRCVREATTKVTGKDTFRFSLEAMMALQEASEGFLIDLLT